MEVDEVRKRIRQLRDAKGLKAHDMAEIVGISRPFYTQLESGTRGISAIYLFRIAKALEMTVGEVCGERMKDEDVGQMKGHMIPVNNPRVYQVLNALLAEKPKKESDWQILLSKAAEKLKSGKKAQRRMAG
jgi:transcriptional regulator with XRE-family HTH domain